MRYRAPKSLTDPIGQIFMAEYDSTCGPTSTRPQCNVTSVPWPLKTQADKNKQPDLLYCFEGGTGARKTSAADGAIWSLMGFVLVREDLQSKQAQRPFDLFIVFRGSRSGRLDLETSVSPVPSRVMSYAAGKGNPDWVTDADATSTDQTKEVSSNKVHRGFATAMETMLPTIEGALRHLIANRQASQLSVPRNIYVTGHSLGGALATCFASAVRCGAFGQRLAKTTPAWDTAWRALSVTTFGAPPAGKKAFKNQFNVAVGNAEGWRLEKDPVPEKLLKGPLTLRFPDYSLTGVDICLPWHASDEASHSPDTMRVAMQEYLGSLSGPQVRRPPDGEKPWTTEGDIREVLIEVTSTLAKTDRTSIPGWLNFKKGLALYLCALSRMKNREKNGNRFSDDQQRVIRDFVTCLFSSKLDSNSFASFMNDKFSKLQPLSKFEADVDLEWNLRAWLGLVAAEDGYQWKAGDPMFAHVKP